MGTDDLSKIVHKLGLSPSWVSNGIGNQFINPIDKERVRKEYDEYIKDKLPTINKESKGSPYYNVDFIGGFDLLMNDQTINPDFYINYPPYNKDGVVWVNLTGYSMEPELRQGDIIALKPVSTPIEYLPTNEIYAIVTEDYRTVKRIELSDREGFIRLLPSNPEYKAQEIPINMITKVYAVLGSIRKFF
jgi:phage repressor protein C with HTH and peptisase S24 domain